MRGAIFLPSLLTLVGLSLGLAAVALYPAPHFAPLALASLLCDMADGFVARRLGAVTRFGAEFDWSVDVALSFAMAWRALPLPAAAVVTTCLLLVQVGSRLSSWRLSGRAVATVAIVCSSMLMEVH